MQKRMHAVLRSHPKETLRKALNSRRNRLGLASMWGELDGVIAILRKENVMVRAHWLKTVVDSWFTETRYPLTCRKSGCIFGCNLLRHPRLDDDAERDDIRHYLRCPQMKWLVEHSMGAVGIVGDVSSLVGQSIDGFDPKLLSTMFATYHGFKLGFGSRGIKFPAFFNVLGKLEEVVGIIARQCLHNAKQNV